MKLLGCLLLLVLMSVYGYCEFWLGPNLAGGLLHRAFPDSISDSGLLEAYVLMALLTIAGILMAKHHLKAIPQELAGAFLGGQSGGGLGSRVVKIAASILIAIPGLFTSALGILMLIPPMPWLLAGIGATLGKSIVRVAMKRMMNGGGPFAQGMAGAGGFGGAGAGGFPFPGGLGGFGGATADDSIRRPKPGAKTYDVSAEKPDPKLNKPT